MTTSQLYDQNNGGDDDDDDDSKYRDIDEDDDDNDMYGDDGGADDEVDHGHYERHGENADNGVGDEEDDAEDKIRISFE